MTHAYKFTVARVEMVFVMLNDERRRNAPQQRLQESNTKSQHHHDNPTLWGSKSTSLRTEHGGRWVGRFCVPAHETIKHLHQVTRRGFVTSRSSGGPLVPKEQQRDCATDYPCILHDGHRIPRYSNMVSSICIRYAEADYGYHTCSCSSLFDAD